MKELSANEMEVWLYDVKRNLQVKKGRQELERAARLREESVMDLEIDFLAPYLERWQARAEGGALTKKQVQEASEKLHKYATFFDLVLLLDEGGEFEGDQGRPRGQVVQPEEQAKGT